MHVVIIGNGVAGVTAALRLREHDAAARITLVSDESERFFSRPALMYVFMGHMRFQDACPHPLAHFDARRIERVKARVSTVELAAQRLVLEGAAEKTLPYDRLLIATGSTPVMLDWPGRALAGVQGLYHLHDLTRLEESVRRARRAVVVGGGLIGVELAEMLLSRGVPVTFFVREASYWRGALPAQESALVTDTVRMHGVDLRLSTELAGIEGQDHARACVTRAGDHVDAEVVGLTIGVRPNIDFLRESGLSIGRGVRVDHALRASAPNVFAAGDCAEVDLGDGAPPRVEQLWYTARAQGQVVGDVLAGKAARYTKGVYFNSAKFFDLEWQTYGRVPADPPPDLQQLYWQAPNARVALRIVAQGGAVVGVNAFGLRQRQAVWTRWIEERRSVPDVLRALRESHFDPELGKRHETAIAGALREQL